MRIFAYAKINLTLDIVGKREDGYHLIDSVFQSVGIYDIVDVKKSNEIIIHCKDLKAEDNIAFVAAKEFFSFTNITGGAEINIEKHIPFLSGLGGGSADAAAVIFALDKIYNTELSSEKLKEIALKCGADVPFFLCGGTARVRGIGEDIEPLPDIKGYYALLVKAGDKKSTKEMYKKLDSLPLQNKKTEDFLNSDNENRFDFVFNAFSLLASDPEIIMLLKSQKPLCVSVSGSGPTHLAVFSSKTDAEKAAQEISKKEYEPIVAPFVNIGLKAAD